MDFVRHFNDARKTAETIDDWDTDRFHWLKAYVASAFAAIAYEEVPEFELRRTKRAKVIPCERYQSHVARWESEQRRPSIRNLEMDAEVNTIVHSRVVVTATRLRNVIVVSFRGTTLSFADFKADLDFRKVKCSIGFGESARLHRGFFDAVLECSDEIVDRIEELDGDQDVPLCVTGHSLGGAMAAIFHARLGDRVQRHFGHHRWHRIQPSTSCYTFGMPRYGDINAKSFLSQPFHIFNELDAIPTLPPTSLGFVDSANERCLNAAPEVIPILRKGNFALRSGKGIATVLGVSDHRMERYVERVARLAGK